MDPLFGIMYRKHKVKGLPGTPNKRKVLHRTIAAFYCLKTKQLNFQPASLPYIHYLNKITELIDELVSLVSPMKIQLPEFVKGFLFEVFHRNNLYLRQCRSA